MFNVHRLTESVQYEKTAGQVGKRRPLPPSLAPRPSPPLLLQNWEDVLFTDVPGYTGLIITVSLILMVSTAVEGVRCVLDGGMANPRKRTQEV